jgi:hypothetical protein
VKIRIRLGIRILLVALSWVVWPPMLILSTAYSIASADQCNMGGCGPPTPPWQTALYLLALVVWLAVLLLPPILVTSWWLRWRIAYRRAAGI